ncbi:conserved hypothetical protein [Uncinocarpus reesii 1704]|uniref:Uncharacterized protein n=1 Tax=Uncinocarpus reesii (strain UAMH 1704) TaxID=336963 RepID=C4JWF6_UNCRE|nr:uncharacterized protein UREG_06898 [Uncinocarpus reesii 1704]EEP82033.1 conserved hypothetical protein [Uncinocarpus reesii 1704]
MQRLLRELWIVKWAFTSKLIGAGRSNCWCKGNWGLGHADECHGGRAILRLITGSPFAPPLLSSLLPPALPPQPPPPKTSSPPSSHTSTPTKHPPAWATRAKPCSTTSPLFGDIRVLVPDYDSSKRKLRSTGNQRWENGKEIRLCWESCPSYGPSQFDLWTALPSLIAALAGAETVSITDHPSSAALSGAVQSCIAQNIADAAIRARISVHPHEWGIFFQTCRDQTEAKKPIGFAAEHQGTFTRIICADCLWMRDQHANLVESLLWFLKPWGNEDSAGRAGDGGLAWIVAGFHTGREIVASFFETAESMGMVVEDIYERDVNATSEMGVVTRPWMPVREGEGPENRARWCVVALLRKKD